MEITEVRIKLMEESGERLRAFCSITFDDCFVVRDLKIIDGVNGLFVAMPSRKLASRCPQCGYKNHLRAGYCNQCGLRLKEDRAPKDENGRAKLYADIAHPINSRCREKMQQRIVEAYHAELDRAKLPGYVSNYDDFHEFEDGGEEYHVLPAPHIPLSPAAGSPDHSSSQSAAIGSTSGVTTRSQGAEVPQGPHRPPVHSATIPSSAAVAGHSSSNGTTASNGTAASNGAMHLAGPHTNGSHTNGLHAPFNATANIETATRSGQRFGEGILD